MTKEDMAPPREKPKLELDAVTQHNIQQLKRVNQVVFPVSYNDRFYKDVVHAGELAKLAYFNDVMVGGVCCRVDTSEGRKRLYIMTLGCLAPYRRYGLGRLMLEHVVALATRDVSVHSIYLHVQVSNEDALAFYQKSGFRIVATEQSYYKRITPSDAYLLERVINRAPQTS